MSWRLEVPKVLMVDPPAGWKYGFPKPCPEDRKNDMATWMVEEGYPQAEMDSYGEHFYCRYWEEETEDEKPTRTRR